MMTIRNTRVWIAALLAMSIALGPFGSTARSAAQDDDPSQKIARQTASSFVIVSYHLKKSDRPYMNGADGPDFGSRSILQRILGKTTLDTVGVILSDRGEVLTFDREPTHREVVDRITIRGPDGTAATAGADRLLVKAPGRILRIEGELPAGWQPLQFAEIGELTPETRLYVASMGTDRYYRVYVKPCDYGLCWSGGDEGSDCLRASGVFCAGVLCNADGQPVGVTCIDQIDLGPGGPAWRGKDILSDPGLPDEQHKQLEERIEKEFARNVYEVRIMPRPQPQEEEERGSGGRYAYARYPGQESGSEKLVYGLAFADNHLLIPEVLAKEFVAGIDTITVKVDDNDVPACFVGVLKDYAATVIELQAGKLPHTLTFPADSTLARVEPFWVVHMRELAGMDVRFEFGRWIDKQQGYEDKWYPVADRSLPTGSWLLDRQGRLVGFLTTARYEYDRLESYLLGRDQSRYRGYMSSMSAWSGPGTVSSLRYMSNVRLLDASHVARVLGDLSANCDPHIRHLDKDAQKRRVWLGVEYTAPDKEMIKQMDLREPTQDGRIGLMVNRVYEDSPAANMGLTEGDLLLTIAVPGTPWPIELMADQRESFSMPDYDEVDVPKEFEAMGWRMPRRRPWPSRENYLTKLLADVGEGTTVGLSFIHDGRIVEKPFTIRQAPRDMLSAAKYKNDKLGLTVKDVTYEVRAALRLKSQEPAVVVVKIEQGTPAALARINTYELIRAVDGASVDSVETLERLITEAQAAQKESVRITVEWMGKTRLADLKFEAKAQAPAGLLDALLRER